MTSRAARAAVLPGALSLFLLAAPAADAQSLTVEDRAGDAPAGELDIRSATVSNSDERVVARVTVADLTRGSVIVSIDRRKGTGLRLVTTRRADGTITGRVLPGAFTDTGGDLSAAPCRQFRTGWSNDNDAVTMTMPSACWNGGDYGALRFAVLTERGGADSDSAPATQDGDIGSSAWVPRG